MQYNRKGKKRIVTKTLACLSVSLLLCGSVSIFAGNKIDKKKGVERVELNYSQRHSKAGISNNLYADGIKIRRDLSVLKDFQETRKLKEEAIPCEDLYGGVWADQHVNSYRAVRNVPDTFDVDLSNFTMPTMGHITSPFGFRHRRMHYGIDLKVQTGDTIYAAFDGVVRVKQYDRRGYGNYLVLRHPNGLETLYGHLSKALVHVDQPIKSGDPIALGGSTGHSTGSHLHFELRYVGNAFDPKKVIDFDNKVCHWNHYVITPATFDYGVFKHGQMLAVTKTRSGKGKNKYASKNLTLYKIRSGDTLGSIAARYKVSIKQICRLNSITSKTVLHLGKMLRLS